MALDLLDRLNGGGPDPRRELLWLMAQGWPAPPELERTHRELTQTGEVMAALAPRGWAPTSQCPVPGYVAAHPYVLSGELDRAEEVVVEGWETSGLLPGNLVRVKGFGSSVGWDLVGEGRYLIVEAAWRLHADGCHVASIPLVLAQVEGICIDATGGRPFFSKGAKRADLTDAVTLAGHHRALGVVRDLLSVDVKTSESTGALVRHGVMHGRELGYGTGSNSWKAWVLLLSVWEWASERLKERIDQRQADAEARWAGSPALDKEGRRLDRRGFFDTRLALRDIAFSEIGFMRAKGRFGTLDELDRTLPGMGDRTGIEVHVEDGRWWAWKRSASGWAFAIGATADGGQFLFWDGGDPPNAGPPGTGWTREEPPNWKSSTIPGRDDPLPL